MPLMQISGNTMQDSFFGYHLQASILVAERRYASVELWPLMIPLDEYEELVEW
jgi:hypothetical protein